MDLLPEPQEQGTLGRTQTAFGRVFNFKLGRFIIVKTLHYINAHTLLELKHRARLYLIKYVSVKALIIFVNYLFRTPRQFFCIIKTV